MHRLGFTRSASHRDHLLHTPDTFVRAPLPGMDKATAIVHAHPDMGAQFTQYTAEFEPDGSLAPARDQRFLYVLEGELEHRGVLLAAGSFAYGSEALRARSKARAAIIEKPYERLPDLSAPEAFSGHEADRVPQPLMGDPALEVRTLIPPGPAFDFAVNTMTFQPGAALPMVEIHVMEHGLLMLDGGGIYRLGEHWYPVSAGDFIWMAPYLPQWFGAIGKIPARYLIYKNWNR